MFKEGGIISMNIYDIAKMANVSIATVSRVVNNSPNVSAKTREKVLRVMAEVEYTPNIFARGLGCGSAKIIGILCPDVSDIYMAKAVGILENELKIHEYQTLLVCSGYSELNKKKSMELLLSKKVDAVIVIGSTYAGNGESSRKTQYIKHAANEIPVFMINSYLPYENVHCVCCDDYEAIYNVANQMICNNHKEILFLFNSESYSANQKMAGYEQALKDNDLPIDGYKKIRVRNNIHDIRDVLLARKDLKFNAVIAVDDNLAIGALKYAKSACMKVPQEINVVGYNNSVLSIYCEPELSSVDSREEELCLQTVDNVIKLLENQESVESVIRVKDRKSVV